MWVARGVTQKRERVAAVGGLGLMVVLAAGLAMAGNPGEPQGGYLGVHVNDISSEKAASLKLSGTQGVVIESLDQDGPACRAGLKSNDAIIAVDGQKVQDTMQLAGMMHGMPGGTVANVTVIRDGKQQDIKVTLGSRHQWMTSMPHPPVPNTSTVAGPAVAPMPPVAFPADVEVPVYTPSAARRGLVVETMTAQLGEFFGVPRGQGVLVRNVQKGSQAASAGLKAGDVIIKINGQVIRDLADWSRSMNSLTGKAALSVIREKREQTVEMNIPVPMGRLHPEAGGLGDSSQQMTELGRQMEALSPQLQRETELAMLGNNDFEKLQRDIDKTVQKQMKHQAKEIEKSMKHLEPQMKKQAEDIQKQMDLMRPEIDKQVEDARKQMDQIGPEIQKQMAEMQKSMTLRQEDIQKMQHDVQESMKDLTPQIQQQMQDMQKQMEQWKKNWPTVERPNEF